MQIGLRRINRLRMPALFAFSYACVCLRDQMLTTLVVDKLLLEKGITDRASRKNQELAAGGVANAGVAFFGGIPGTVLLNLRTKNAPRPVVSCRVVPCSVVPCCVVSFCSDGTNPLDTYLDRLRTVNLLRLNRRNGNGL